MVGGSPEGNPLGIPHPRGPTVPLLSPADTAGPSSAPKPRAHMLHSNSGTMWHLEIPCPELLLGVWEAIPQIGIEGSLAAEEATVFRKE